MNKVGLHGKKDRRLNQLSSPKPEFDSAVAMYVVSTVPRGNKLLKENLKQGEKKMISQSKALLNALKVNAVPFFKVK